MKSVETKKKKTLQIEQIERIISSGKKINPINLMKSVETKKKKTLQIDQIERIISSGKIIIR